MMKARTWRQRCPTRPHRTTKIAALLTAMLASAQCSTVPLESSAQQAAPANYSALVSTNLKSFKGFSGYSNFAISGLRWVHPTTGWSWLACVRFDDHGRQLYYAFFIKDNLIVAGRYAVRTDQCRAQPYQPLNVASGAIEAPAVATQPAPGTEGGPRMMQGPIY